MSAQRSRQEKPSPKALANTGKPRLDVKGTTRTDSEHQTKRTARLDGRELFLGSTQLAENTSMKKYTTEAHQLVPGVTLLDGS